MPIAEALALSEIVKCAIQGFIGNRADAGVVTAAMQCVRQLADSAVPENHHVLKAMHGAFAKSIGIMALACDPVGGSPADHFSRRALQRFARSRALTDVKLDGSNLPVETLEGQVRAIYGQQKLGPKEAATSAVISVVEAAMGDTLTEPLREVFRFGHGRYAGWADTFELYFAADVKANTSLYRILTFDRQNELVELANVQAEMLHRLTDDFEEFRAEYRADHAEIMAALGRMEAAQHKGDVAPAEALQIIHSAVRDGRLTDEQQARLAEIYADYLRITTNIPAPLIASAARELSTADDIDLLDAALRNLAGEERKLLIAEAEARIDDQVAAAAARYRRLASFAALESLAAGVRLYAKAVDIDPMNVWSWIELRRLHFAMGSLADATRCAGRAEQIASDPRDVAVVQNELAELDLARGSLAVATARLVRAHDAIAEIAAVNLGDLDSQRDLSISYNKLGDVAATAGNLDEARARFAKGLAIRERLAATDPGNVGWQRDLSVSYNKLGNVAVLTGNYDEARGQFAKDLAIAEYLAATDPGNAEWQRDLSVSHERLGDVAVRAGNLDEARAQFAKDLAIAERLATADPGNAGWQRDLSVSHDRLGDVAVRVGNLDEARAQFAKGLTIRECLAAADPGNAGWQRDLFVSHMKLAQLGEAERDPGTALYQLEAAEKIMAALVERSPDHPGFARDLENVRTDLARLQG